MENMNDLFVSTNYGNKTIDKSYNIKVENVKFNSYFKGNKKIIDKYIVKKDAKIFNG